MSYIDMATFNFKQLIDLAIGTPDAGHVNFHALHCLLYSFAEHLNVMDKSVDCSKYGNINASMIQSEGPPSADSSSPPAGEAVGGADSGNSAGSGGGANTPSGPENAAGTDSGADPTSAAPTSAEPTNAAPSNAAPTSEAPTSAAPTSAAPAITEQRLPAGTEPSAAPGPAAGRSGSFAEPGAPAVRGTTSGAETAGNFNIVQNSAVPESGTGLAQDLIISGQLYRPASMNPEHESFRNETIQRLEQRVSQIETSGGLRLSSDVRKGIAVMKEQIESTIDQVQTLTSLQLNGTDANNVAQNMDKLRNQSKQLQTVRHANKYIKPHAEGIVEYNTDEGVIDEVIEDTVSERPIVPVSKQPAGRPGGTAADERYSLDLHLCYSPEKMLEQLMDLKSEFCTLTNKMNDMSAMVLQLESQRTATIVLEIQEELREMKGFSASVKGLTDMLEARQNNSSANIDQIHKALKELMEDKIDRGEIDVLLANKVDYKQLQRKVSHEQVEEIKCKLERQFCTLGKLMDSQEKNLQKEMDDMRVTMGSNAIEQILKKFKEKIETDLRSLTETLQKYMDSTNDECAAAGARIKVLQDLACLSCDTTCVMRTAEKAKVGKLPNAPAGSMLAPLVTYELSSIRKSGLMGYYRKDEFPHTPSSWTNRQNMSMKACVPRHAGGPHTTSTAKERVDKVLLNKK